MALLVDRAELRDTQLAGDVLRTHRAPPDANETDVRPILTASRDVKGLPLDPIEVFRSEGHDGRLALERA
jgi:L-rhamnose isomerase